LKIDYSSRPFPNEDFQFSAKKVQNLTCQVLKGICFICDPAKSAGGMGGRRITHPIITRTPENFKLYFHDFTGLWPKPVGYRRKKTKAVITE